MNRDDLLTKAQDRVKQRIRKILIIIRLLNAGFIFNRYLNLKN